MHTPTQPGKPPPQATPDGAASAQEPDPQRLALLFATEPELIPACLESTDSDRALNPEIVLAAAQQAVKQRPRYADLYYFAAQAAERANKLEQARALLGSALKLNPQYNAALILAARICTLQGEHDEALRHLREAVFNGAAYADVHLMLGDLWRDREDFTRAREAYHCALQINADLPSARQSLSALEAEIRRRGTDELPA